MRPKLPVFLLFAALVLVAAISYASFRDASSGGFFLREHVPSGAAAAGMHAFTSDELGVRFRYPDLYYLREAEVGTAARPQRAIVLVEDTQENRDLLDGVPTAAREGPTSIMIDVYANPRDLSARDWALAQTNWIARAGPLTPVEVAGEAGISYGWDGLYAGRSAIVTRAGHAYVFSVTWMTDQDRILEDYEALLASVRFAEPSGR
jgi:hypothetical protein